MKKRVEVTVWVNVEVDESKFDESFMEKFREDFYPFYSIEGHIRHLAQLEARGISGEFIEGYGKVEDMGIRTETLGWETCSYEGAPHE